ncbi:death-associated protein-like 1-A [Boleophthalmus pectinirostris]|uniref:death-associated protein-like 1-A n=1 Tax=Boleophthalmus pectinirostris TaxID=150288 RepID=UPI000A1C4429|nr:death-associated protein-like 1-A [Boleophthalmus pectinirostris]
MVQPVSKPAGKTATVLKAGHPPAVKAGGKRVAKKSIEDSSTPEKDAKRTEKIKPVPAPNRINQVNLLLSGTLDKLSHDFPETPVSVRHSRVRPAVEKPHCPKTYFIQQPRKF